MNLLGPPSDNEVKESSQEKLKTKNPKIVYREAGFSAHNYEPLLRSNNPSEQRKARFEHQDLKRHVSVRTPPKPKEKMETSKEKPVTVQKRVKVEEPKIMRVSTEVSQDYIDNGGLAIDERPSAEESVNNENSNDEIQITCYGLQQPSVPTRHTDPDNKRTKTA